MKKQIFTAMACLLALSLTTQSFTQNTSNALQKTKTKSNQSNDRSSNPNVESSSVKIRSTPNGCEIVFNQAVVSPRDVATGQASGKRTHKPVCFTVNSSDNSIMEITSPRDVASGQASGKRTAGNPIKGISVKGGKIPGGNQFNNVVVNNGQFTLPDKDCDDGDYDLILSWSWGESNPGSSKTSCQSHFILTFEDGACVGIKTRGTRAASK